MTRIFLLAVLTVAHALPNITAAFLDDGFVVDRWVSYEHGRGAVASSTTSTTLKTGEAKKAYYVEGTAYEMGFVMALMSEHEMGEMCTTYIEHLVPQLVASALDQKYINSTLYDDLCELVADLIIVKGLQNFYVWNNASGGDLPVELVQEMQGMADGALHVRANTNVSFDRLIALNYGIDFLMASVYAGKVYSDLAETAMDWAKEGRLSVERAADVSVHLLDPAFILQPPAACNFFGVRGSATKSGKDVYMGRDFMFSNAFVFQFVQAPVIRRPSDGRAASISAGAPGWVGASTAMNEHGVGIDVQVMMAGNVDAKRPGLNSLLLTRHVIDVATDLASGIDAIADAQRGCAWLYPLCDATGDCAVLETGLSLSGSAPPSFLSYVGSDDLKKDLPSEDWFAQHEPEYRKGVFVRRMNTSLPDMTPFNTKLFARADVPFNSSMTARDGMIFSTFQEDNAACPKISNSFFSPLRQYSDDVITATNYAMIPNQRVAMMARDPTVIQAVATPSQQFRYDYLHRALDEASGTIDFAKARDLINFLRPSSMPGFYGPPKDIPLVPGQPNTMAIQGSLQAMDLGNKLFSNLGGYYTDKWITLSLPKYL